MSETRPLPSRNSECCGGDRRGKQWLQGENSECPGIDRCGKKWLQGENSECRWGDRRGKKWLQGGTRSAAGETDVETNGCRGELGVPLGRQTWKQMAAGGNSECRGGDRRVDKRLQGGNSESPGETDVETNGCRGGTRSLRGRQTWKQTAAGRELGVSGGDRRGNKRLQGGNSESPGETDLETNGCRAGTRSLRGRQRWKQTAAGRELGVSGGDRLGNKRLQGGNSESPGETDLETNGCRGGTRSLRGRQTWKQTAAGRELGVSGGDRGGNKRLQGGNSESPEETDVETNGCRAGTRSLRGRQRWKQMAAGRELVVSGGDRLGNKRLQGGNSESPGETDVETNGCRAGTRSLRGRQTWKQTAAGRELGVSGGDRGGNKRLQGGNSESPGETEVETNGCRAGTRSLRGRQRWKQTAAGGELGVSGGDRLGNKRLQGGNSESPGETDLETNGCRAGTRSLPGRQTWKQTAAGGELGVSGGDRGGNKRLQGGNSECPGGDRGGNKRLQGGNSESPGETEVETNGCRAGTRSLRGRQTWKQTAAGRELGVSRGDRLGNKRLQGGNSESPGETDLETNGCRAGTRSLRGRQTWKQTAAGRELGVSRGDRLGNKRLQGGNSESPGETDLETNGCRAGTRSLRGRQRWKQTAAGGELGVSGGDRGGNKRLQGGNSECPGGDRGGNKRLQGGNSESPGETDLETNGCRAGTRSLRGRQRWKQMAAGRELGVSRGDRLGNKRLQGGNSESPWETDLETNGCRGGTRSLRGRQTWKQTAAGRELGVSGGDRLGNKRLQGGNSESPGETDVETNGCRAGTRSLRGRQTWKQMAAGRELGVSGGDRLGNKRLQGGNSESPGETDLETNGCRAGTRSLRGRQTWKQTAAGRELGVSGGDRLGNKRLQGGNSESPGETDVETNGCRAGTRSLRGRQTWKQTAAGRELGVSGGDRRGNKRLQGGNSESPGETDLETNGCRAGTRSLRGRQRWKQTAAGRELGVSRGDRLGNKRLQGGNSESPGETEVETNGCRAGTRSLRGRQTWKQTAAGRELGVSGGDRLGNKRLQGGNSESPGETDLETNGCRGGTRSLPGRQTWKQTAAGGELGVPRGRQRWKQTAAGGELGVPRGRQRWKQTAAGRELGVSGGDRLGNKRLQGGNSESPGETDLETNGCRAGTRSLRGRQTWKQTAAGRELGVSRGDRLGNKWLQGGNSESPGETDLETNGCRGGTRSAPGETEVETNGCRGGTRSAPGETEVETNGCRAGTRSLRGRQRWKQTAAGRELGVSGGDRLGNKGLQGGNSESPGETDLETNGCRGGTRSAPGETEVETNGCRGGTRSAPGETEVETNGCRAGTRSLRGRQRWKQMAAGRELGVSGGDRRGNKWLQGGNSESPGETDVETNGCRAGPQDDSEIPASDLQTKCTRGRATPFGWGQGMYGD
ncbi:uncharacterized protein LOC128931306 [Callithrix jacchus]